MRMFTITKACVESGGGDGRARVYQNIELARAIIQFSAVYWSALSFLIPF